MKKIWKRVCTGLLTLTTILTALPTTSVQAAETQYWTESSERVGYIEHVMNDGTIYSTFNEGHMRVEGETAYEYSCAMKSHFRKFGNQMSGSGNHLCKYMSLLA